MMTVIIGEESESHKHVSATCKKCGETKELTIDSGGWIRVVWLNEHVQSVFPELSASERELILQNDEVQIGVMPNYYLCPPCWDLTIPADDIESFDDFDGDDDDQRHSSASS